MPRNDELGESSGYYYPRLKQQMRVRIPAALTRPSLAKLTPSKIEEGAGNAA